MNIKLPPSVCVDGLAAQGTSPSVEAVVRFDSNSDSVHVQKIVSTLSTDNVQYEGTENICTIDISAIVQEQVQLQVENFLKQKLLDLNANVVQAVDKPISTPLHSAIPHFDKFKSYDVQMSTIESNADQVSYHALEENLDDCVLHSPQSCQMYTCIPVEVPQEAPDKTARTNTSKSNPNFNKDNLRAVNLSRKGNICRKNVWGPKGFPDPRKLGLSVNRKKSNLKPPQLLEYLGALFNLKIGIVTPTETRYHSILEIIHIIQKSTDSSSSNSKAFWSDGFICTNKIDNAFKMVYKSNKYIQRNAITAAASSVDIDHRCFRTRLGSSFRNLAFLRNMTKVLPLQLVGVKGSTVSSSKNCTDSKEQSDSDKVGQYDCDKLYQQTRRDTFTKPVLSTFGSLPVEYSEQCK
ncbi:unnamed protein product [Mytilus coruscus]|uniref:Uncharacterized protein n=1 Tax=Mytilus coruscus TaxID=42192 RepID=A0A6J8F1E9_MYTCO|nr:unnamed protein product [Mytilus coruscus]